MNRHPVAIVFFFIALHSFCAAAQWVQQGQKLLGTGANGPASQGTVALSADGNTAVVGGNSDSNQIGAVWIWARSGGVWTQQGSKLVGSGAVGSSNQGFAVAISADGNTVLAGGLGDNGFVGAAWVWIRSGGVWTQQGDKLVGSGASPETWQGASVALSADGNTALIGGIEDDGATGAAWVWTRTNGVWTQQGNKLVGFGAAGKARQGSVALSADGNTAIIGGQNDDNGAGAAWIWTRSNGVWTQVGNKLVGSGGSPGARQGNQVALAGHGNTALVGAFADDGQTGAAWVWVKEGAAWRQEGGKLVGSGAVGAAGQGVVSLSGDGNRAIIGGPFDNNEAGAAWAWTRSGGVWTQDGPKLVGSGATPGGTKPPFSARQGTRVAISADGGTAIVAGFRDNQFTGGAWVFVSRIPPRRRVAAH